ncbi:MAG: hypothetical protein IPH33_08570 [Bacteroidetes bacterium]|nr:hypothetical protein [Bacteroidota bacterium]
MLSIFVKRILVMDIQLWVVIGFFAAAVFFIIRKIYLQMKGKKQSGCEKCDVVGKTPEKAVSK